MTTYYVDSSALVKRYVNETGSDWLQALCTPAAGHTLALAHIGLVELAAALAMKVRQGTLDAATRDALLRDVQHDAMAQYWLIDVDQEIVVRAMALTRIYKLRGYDALHLASALFLRDTLQGYGLTAPVVLTADLDLLDAVQAEGLLVEDPNQH